MKIAVKSDLLLSEDLLSFFLEIVRNRGSKNIVLGATLQLDKLLQTLGEKFASVEEKFIEDIWANFLQIWASLGNSLGQIFCRFRQA